MSPSKEKNSVFTLVILIFVLAFLFVNPFSRFLFAKLLFGVNHLPGFSEFHVGFGLPPFGAFLPFFPTLILFLFWLFVTIWVYNDAEKKNMSGILWGLLVFVGNVIGLIIYLIVRSGTVTNTTPIPIQQKKCPSCSQAMRDDFKLCPHCGTSLRNECSSCNKNVESDWKVCPYCGTELK